MSEAEDRARTRCRQHEGCVLKPYRDTEGKWTVGIGHRCSASQRPITRNEAEDLFRDDWKLAMRQAQDLELQHLVGLDETRRCVVAEMCFQLGKGGTVKFRKMWAALRVGDYIRAAAEMLDSKWHGQTPARCERLADVMLRGIDRPIEHPV